MGDSSPSTTSTSSHRLIVHRPVYRHHYEINLPLARQASPMTENSASLIPSQQLHPLAGTQSKVIPNHASSPGSPAKNHSTPRRNRFALVTDGDRYTTGMFVQCFVSLSRFVAQRRGFIRQLLSLSMTARCRRY